MMPHCCAVASSASSKSPVQLGYLAPAPSFPSLRVAVRCRWYACAKEVKTNFLGSGKECISRESSPGHIDGNDVFYHLTTGAAVFHSSFRATSLCALSVTAHACGADGGRNSLQWCTWLLSNCAGQRAPQRITARCRVCLVPKIPPPGLEPGSLG